MIQTHTANVGPYCVKMYLDADGHLSIYVNAHDGTAVIDAEQEIAEDGVYGVRLTTAAIETTYRDTSR